MAYASDTTRSQSAFGAGFAGYVARLQTALRKRKAYRQTLNELRSLSDRDLYDLGIHRGMIKRIAWQAAQDA